MENDSESTDKILTINKVQSLMGDGQDRWGRQKGPQTVIIVADVETCEENISVLKTRNC